MSEAQGIKNMMEIIAAVKLLAVAGKEVMADGKLSLTDLPVAMKLAQNAQVFIAAVEGAGEVVAEAKDLTAEETKQLVDALFGIVAAYKAA